MSIEESGLMGRQIVEDGFPWGDVATGDERRPVGEHEALDKQVFRLALALASEPSKLWQLRQMMALVQEESTDCKDFSSWAIQQIDKKVMSMALEYAHDAEVLLQILSFKGDTFASLMQSIEDFYRQEQISQRVYARAKLLLWTHEQAQQ